MSWGHVFLEVLAVIFQQGIKGTDLRERCLDFISHHVMASRKELFKDPEIEVYFAGEMQKVRERVVYCMLCYKR